VPRRQRRLKTEKEIFMGAKISFLFSFAVAHAPTAKGGTPLTPQVALPLAKKDKGGFCRRPKTALNDKDLLFFHKNCAIMCVWQIQIF
jgi:hypothetical protein